jgi:hypothetical protein
MKFPLSALLAAGFCLNVSPLEAAQLNTKSTPAFAQPSPPAAPAAPETKFDAVIDDLPLMTGLTPVPDEDTLFVEPHAGRIAESVATGEVAIDDIYAFYRRALPHLGWEMVDGRTYRRGGERLRIDARANGNTATVRFSIKPG